MNMTLTPLSLEQPPRVVIELDSGSAAVFGSIVLYRDGVPVRKQPDVGGTTASTVDYFPTLQQDIVYRAVTDLGVFTATTMFISSTGWLIHASQPSLSIPLKKDSAIGVNVKAIGQVSSDSAATVHRPIGSAVGISKRSGPRPAGTRTVTLQTFTADDAIALDDILSDDTPLLFRFPGSWRVRFAETWWQVTQHSEDLPFDMPAEYYREWQLSLSPVSEPKLIVSQLWSWSTLRDSGFTWGTLPLGWRSWRDLRIDRRA